MLPAFPLLSTTQEALLEEVQPADSANEGMTDPLLD
jgi:hypothetical protein